MAATVEKLDGPVARLEGYVDAQDGGRLFGWAWDRLHPDERLLVEISVDGTVVTTVTADQPRPDLRAGGIGDGGHAFEVELPDGCSPIATVVSSTGERLELTPRGPEDPGAETLALLRQLTGAVDQLGRGQRRLGAALAERSKPAVEADDLQTQLAELATVQQALQKQQDTFELFLVRFDGLLRQMAERMDAPPARKPSLFDRIFPK